METIGKVFQALRLCSQDSKISRAYEGSAARRKPLINPGVLYALP